MAGPDARPWLERADRALGLPLSRLVAHGPAEALRPTRVAQPALVAVAVAEAERVRGARPAYLVGHSVGQYAALVAAGALGFEDAVWLVALRGALMQRAVPEGRGAMAAIVGLEVGEVRAACDAASEVGAASIACFNAPGHLVISGDAAAVEVALDRCADLGGGVVPLDVSAPFHSALLAPMAPTFREALARVRFGRPAIPVVDNVSARPIDHPDDLREALVEHLQAPVRFEESVRYLVERGVDTVIQCGPGTSLLKFARAIEPALRGHRAEPAFAAGDLRASGESRLDAPPPAA